MYLDLFESDAETSLYRHCAYLLAISHADCPEPAVSQNPDNASSTSEPTEMKAFKLWTPRQQKMECSWDLSRQWENLLDKQWREMGETFYDDAPLDFEEIIDEMWSHLEEVSSLSRTEKRQAVIDRLVTEIDDNDDIQDIADRSRRIIVLELFLPAWLEKQCEPLEHYTISKIAEKLNIGPEDLSALEALGKKYAQVYRQGLEMLG